MRLANETAVSHQTALVANSSTGGFRGSTLPLSLTHFTGSGRGCGGQGHRRGGGCGTVSTQLPSGPWLYINLTALQQAGLQVWQVPGSGILGRAPSAQAYHTTYAPLQLPAPTPPPTATTIASSSSGTPEWDPTGLIAALNSLSPSGWVIDTGASSHMASEEGVFLCLLPIKSPSSVMVGNGSHIPVTLHGDAAIRTPSSNFVIHNVLYVPSLIKNLFYVRQFTRDNPCSIEFDYADFSIKDLRTRCVSFRYNSHRDLYAIPPFTGAANPQAHVATTISASLWHQCLGHLVSTLLNKLQHSSSIACNKAASSTCHACQLGKHTRLPFISSSSYTISCFELFTL